MNQIQKKVLLTYFKTTTLLITTFCLGCIIAAGVARLLENDKNIASNAKPVPSDDCEVREVFVLKNMVRDGNKIFPGDVLVVHRPKDMVPSGAVKTYQQIEGRSVKVELPQGTVLLDEYFVARLASSQAKGFIPPGYHSVQVHICEQVTDRLKKNSVVRPGDQVDVIIVNANEETGEKSGEHVILEKIPVIDTLWSELDESRQFDKNGSVTLLLSELQRKNLQDKFQEGMTIRLRICPQVEAKAFSELQPQDTFDMADSHNFYQTERQPYLISQSLTSGLPEGDIEIVFRNNAHQHDNTPTFQVLKPVTLSSSHIPVLRGILENSYANESQAVSQVSAVGKSKPIISPVENRPIPRYLSFYDPLGHKPNGTAQWQIVTHSPVVYEARPDFQTQTRGVYREGSVYYSAE